MSEQQYYDPLNPKYKCLCGCCHVTTFTKIICWVSIALSLFSIFSQLVHQPSMPKTALSALLLTLLIYGSPLYAINTCKSLWMLPLIIVTGFQFVIALIVILGLLLYFLLQILSVENLKQIFHNNSNESSIAQTMFMIIVIAVILFIFGWMFEIYYHCYQYLYEKKRSNIPPLNVQQPVELCHCHANQPPVLKFQQYPV